MTKRGLFTLAYADGNHKHAVTSVTSANTGTFNYSYDESGNMIARNGDTMAYNTQGKLKEIKTTGGDVMEYLYESTGNRIRKRMKNSGVTVYSFDGLYDITRTKELESHTLYFKGLYGDIFSQMTRNDALLRADRDSAFDFILIKNQLTQYSREKILSVYGSMIDYRAMLVLATMFILLGYGLLLLNDSMTTLNFPIPLVLACYILLFSSCGNFKSDKKGEAPWLLLANGITDKTPSIDDVPPTGSTAGASASSGSTLIAPTGMYFLHPDHLGSVTMITDGNGNVISGGNNGGKSSINYKPYGEVNRTDSSGPDISKFKYTGQEEDKESGLLYYKARYYDPMLGRFLQADSVVMPNESFGMNRYMYVSGSPVRYVDPRGNAKGKNLMADLAGGLTLAAKIGNYKNFNAQNANGGMNYFTSGFNGNKAKEKRRNDAPGRLWDTTIGNDGIVGWIDDGIDTMRVYFARWTKDIAGESYTSSKEGKINKGISDGLGYCVIDPAMSAETKETCGILGFAYNRYNQRQRQKYKNHSFFGRSKPVNVRFEEVVACSILFGQESVKRKQQDISKYPAHPNPPAFNFEEEIKSGFDFCALAIYAGSGD